MEEKINEEELTNEKQEQETVEEKIVEEKKDVLMDEEEKKQDSDKKTIKINKKTVIVFAVIIVVLFLTYFIRSCFVAATVDGSPISRISIVRQLEKSYGQELLDSMITQKLVQNEAKAKNIIVPEEDINQQIKTIEDQLSAQGSSLEVALTAQGLTIDFVKEQMTTQKQLELLISDKVSVTDEEVSQYIKDNNITIEKGQEETTKEQVKDALTNMKLSDVAQSFIAELKAKANIKYIVKY
ncbi:MAG TPA: hypothetical protein PLD95_03345 [bacterium]|jgi:foldase protein PrsA|nr:hypothetical protein [bacterium]HOG38481.1 hypothetical protein [bacterium]HQI03538.1 hypothetical protein [bacterium]